MRDRSLSTAARPCSELVDHVLDALEYFRRRARLLCGAKVSSQMLAELIDLRDVAFEIVDHGRSKRCLIRPAHGADAATLLQD